MPAATLHTGPFYAYIHNVRDSSTWSIIAIFASRDVADEWWRAISTARNSTGQSLNIHRVAPQFYTHDPDQRWNVADFFDSDDPQIHDISDSFRENMFLNIQKGSMRDARPGTVGIIPTQSVVDHTSGSWFKIRSQSDPSQYWYYNYHLKCLDLSDIHDNRTSFKISGVGLEDGTIMIGKDRIIIYAENMGFVGWASMDGLEFQPVDLPLAVTRVASGSANTFSFMDFRLGRFKLSRGGRFTYSGSGPPGSCAWELAL